MRAWGSLLLVAWLGCDRTPATRASRESHESDESPPAATATVPAAKPVPSARPEPARDLEDQFEYGTLDAGAADPRLLATHPGYEPYVNPRFGFSLDAPKALTSMPPPTNGDGLQWRLGTLVAMTASGMYSPYEGAPKCASTPSVTGHRETKNTCWATGKRGRYIFWERSIVKDGVLFSLRFQYEESLKEAMDPIVGHVNASWKQPGTP